MSDCSFDFDEIQGAGTFNFQGDDDFNLDPIDGFPDDPPQEETKEEELPVAPVLLEEPSSQDEIEGQNMNDMAIANYGSESDDEDTPQVVEEASAEEIAAIRSSQEHFKQSIFSMAEMRELSVHGDLPAADDITGAT